MSRKAWVLITLIFCLPASVAANPEKHTVRKGPVGATVTVKPSDLLVGDTVTLELHVVAEKDVELLMPQFGEALERFSILDFTTDEQIDSEDRTMVVQTYELQPLRSGKQSIPPIMIEFVDHRDGQQQAPEGMDAYEILTPTVAFEVKSVLPDDAHAELNHQLDHLPPLVTHQPASWIWPVASGTALVFMAVALCLWLRARRKARQRTSYEIALDRMQGLLYRPRNSPEQIDAFFVELSAIIRWYLENRFDLRAPELTTEEFLTAMSSSPDLATGHQPLLRDFLRQADLVKFANFVPNSTDIADSVSSARRFLNDTRQNQTHGDPGSRQSATTRLKEAARV